ncbi:uncharacterized protein LOC117170925 [Belonocnema kinseyi]|uniref:uncharacterized protein LOC117170925 n=1 Tax=Belonocnema kinseyi TaxID=2817044 RepID=UPI00143D1848|nr:uncharacterized protein LOC117170925 [Belonocnema kinseyi]
MKFPAIFSIIVIFGYVGYSSAMSMVEPISFVLQVTYNLPVLDWESKCSESYKDIVKLTRETGNLTLFLLPGSISEKLPNSKSTEGLDDLIKKDCIGSQDLKNISQKVVSSVQKCLEEDKKLDTANEEEMKKALINSMCRSVQSSIEWNIQSIKFTQNQ